MPADPTTNLGASRLPTEQDDIGHIAPSYESPKRFNTLAIRPQYRISLRLGEIEKIFDTKPDTKEGRMARLQVLGLFYWPLNHRVAAGKLPPNTPGYEAKVKPLRSHATAARDKANAFRTKANALEAKRLEMTGLTRPMELLPKLASSICCATSSISCRPLQQPH